MKVRGFVYQDKSGRVNAASWAFDYRLCVQDAFETLPDDADWDAIMSATLSDDPAAPLSDFDELHVLDIGSAYLGTVRLS